MALGFQIANIGNYDVLTWVHDKDSPSDSEWAATVEQVRHIVQKRGGVTTLRTIVTSQGGGPSTVQRNLLFRETYQGKPVKVAVFDPAFNNPILRGIVTAVMWINPGVKPFKLDDWKKGLEHVDLLHEKKALASLLDAVGKTMPTVASTRALHDKLLAG